MKSEVQNKRWEAEIEKGWGPRLNDYFEALLQVGLIHADCLPYLTRAGLRRSVAAN